MNDLLDEFSDDVTARSTPKKPPKPMWSGDDSFELIGSSGNEEKDLARPWMRLHRFELVKSVARVRELVDRAISVGRCSLDTETQGLDTRIEADENGKLYTRHRIVGYCLGIEGEGFYIPVRHRAELKKDASPNIDSVEEAEREITRLCEAAQPILKDGNQDILGAKEKDFEVPPRVIIEFWHAKFDQEMLYPVTGIDLWNPYSFEDGMLMVYVLHTEDEQGLKENAYSKIDPIKDPKSGEEHRYEMIEYISLFPKGMKKAERKIEMLVPREEGQGRNVMLYGCSDGICTNLLCKKLKPLVQAKANFQSFYLLEKQVAQVVRVIERTRVLINKGEISTLLQEAEDELLACEDRIRKLAIAAGFPQDFNPASSSQLADFLFGPRGIWTGEKPEKTTEGQYKTDEKTIEEIAKDPKAKDLEAFPLIIKHRQINKVKGTYLQNLANNTDELDQLRLNFRQTGAATGRFTAPKGDPEHGYAGVPIQGIPAKDDPKKPKVAHSLRRMFIARTGYHLIKVDYASQELRIGSSVSGEQKWIAEYEKEAETGIPADLHALTAYAFYPGLTKDSPDFKLKRGAGKCVAAESLVFTHKGLSTIESLGIFGGPDSFVDAPKDLTIDGNPVVSLYNGGKKIMVHVVSRRGQLTCTLAHRFRMANGSLICADDLKPGMELEPFIAEGIVPVAPHWRNIGSAGPFLARHHYYNGAPAQIASIEGGMVEIAPCDPNTPNTVLAVIPAGVRQCYDVSLATEQHLYRANCLMTHNTANFALIYGGGVGAVQRATGCDKIEGARMKAAFDASVPSFSKWVKKQHKAVKTNLGVATAFGRFIAIPDANIDRDEMIRRFKVKGVKFSEQDVAKETNKIRAACERKATNYPIQGSGADILKISLVLLLREFHLRHWLKSGGDDSVRIVMTVHDEIVFEVRDDRVAEALPIITRIMEYPGVLAKWRVPLVAEAEIGSSWAAKISWSALLKGEGKVPPFLEGVELRKHAEVLVLDKPNGRPPSTPPPASPAPVPSPVSAPAPKPVVSETPAPILPKPAPSNSSPTPSKTNGVTKIAAFKLRTMHVDRNLVCQIAQACSAAKIEAIKQGELDQLMIIEFWLGGERDVLLYSAREDYRTHVDELKINLRHMGLFESCSIREENA